MEIEVKIDEAFLEPKVIILTDKMSEEIETLIRKISEKQPEKWIGFLENSLEILEPQEVIRIFTEKQKVYAQTKENTYLLRARLYEMEEQMDRTVFVRISHSEIINLKKVKNMDLSFTGTICIHLAGNVRTFVSRRYVPKIKQVLGI